MDQTSQETKTNKHFSLILKVEIIAFLAVLFFVLKLSFGVLASTNKIEASDLTISNILEAVNQERRLRNIPTLTPNSKLSNAAQFKAEDMITRNYFAHVDPDGNYIWPKIAAEGYSPYLQLGENLAIEFYNTESLVAAWMNSPTHRANLLNEGFKDQGMGLSFGTGGQYNSSVANTFGTLQPSKKTQPKNPTPAPKKEIIPETPKPVETIATTPAEKPTPKETTITQKTPPKPNPPKPITNPIPTTTPTTTNPTTTNTVITQKTGNPIKPRTSPNEPDVKSEATEQVTENYNNQTQSTATTTSSQPVINTTREKTDKTNNRYLILTFGLIILYILFKDLSINLEKSPEAVPDKKINNLFVLVLSLFVIALLYWL